MSSKKSFRTFLTLGVLATAASASFGCVSSRPSRNGVFNENQYLRKDFLIHGAADGSQDPGWVLKATVTETDAPNILGPANIWSGSHNGYGNLVRFQVTGDHLNMVSLREIAGRENPDAAQLGGLSTQNIPSVMNAWPITNVDLKYRVNLDGETTNFYEENQEANWQDRQWVKVNLNKNDMSDVAPLGNYTAEILNTCTDISNASASFVPDSLIIDQGDADNVYDDYLSWKVQITVPVKVTDAACYDFLASGFGGDSDHFRNASQFLGVDHPNATFNLQYSLMRAKPQGTDSVVRKDGSTLYGKVDTAANTVTDADNNVVSYDPSTSTVIPAFKPLELDEKDPIRHKYGPLTFVAVNRDVATQNMAAREFAIHYNPQSNAPVVWYFAPSFPAEFRNIFLRPGGIKEKTNAFYQSLGVPLRFDFQPVPEFLDGNNQPLTGDACTGAGGIPMQEVAGPHCYKYAFGDVRFNWLYWHSYDETFGAAGVTQHVVDPRTGETLSATIGIEDFPIQDYYVQRLDAYLASMGATAGVNPSGVGPDGKPINPLQNADGSWVDGPPNCKDGDTMPIVPATLAANHNGSSSLYTKMQLYLQKPAPTYGALGPADFIVDHTQDNGDFYNAYFKLLPFAVFRDPATNYYVTPEGGSGVYGPANIWAMVQKETAFHQAMAAIDRGEAPYDDYTGPNGLQSATAFLNKWKDYTANHMLLGQARNYMHPGMELDLPTFSYGAVVAKDARHCINGAWETKEQWIANLTDTYWSQTIWHEFGHALGLDHNFMANIDMNNFPHYTDGAGRDHIGLYASSIMEYNGAPDRVFWGSPDYAPWDKGALGWIYTNNYDSTKPVTTNADGSVTSGTKTLVQATNFTVPQYASISGQFTSTNPWNDPAGFKADKTTEVAMLNCNADDMMLTPTCRQGDLGVTPSEIIANQIDRYENNFQWVNYRTFHKFWDNTNYGDGPAGMMYDVKRFISMWVFDWSDNDLVDTFRRIGIVNPDPHGSSQQYYDQLTNKFNQEMSTANQLVAAMHKAIIQQSAGERPYKTIYDKYYGDTTQQGIILDKLFAMQSWVALWPTDNYDLNQAGSYIASYEGIGDSSYNYVSADAVTSMIGGQYDVYPYFVPLAVAQYAQDTHSPSFGNPQMRDWIGGHVFYRLDDFLAYFRDLAVQNAYPGCPDIATCSYDPRGLSDSHNEFFGPDKRQWIWAYVTDRNTWVAVEKERNTASYIIVRSYTDDVIFQLDDGAFPGGAYGAQLPMKYFLDSFNYYN